jgi:hypothetical protein
MEFMKKEVTNHQWWIEIDGTQGITFVPYDVLSKDEITIAETCEDILEDAEDTVDVASVFGGYYEGTVQSVTCRQGFGARLSAPGYLDCTEWTVFDTAKEAQSFLTEQDEEDKALLDELRDGLSD